MINCEGTAEQCGVNREHCAWKQLTEGVLALFMTSGAELTEVDGTQPDPCEAHCQLLQADQVMSRIDRLLGRREHLGEVTVSDVAGDEVNVERDGKENES